MGLLAQSEVGELRETGEVGKGGSSTLPQKANPVRSEILVTLARYNANELGAMHQALLHESERSGAAWSLEWLSLPNMILAASGALAHATQLAENLVVDAKRMQANIDAANGLCLAEAVSFALSVHLPRTEAQTLTAAACRRAGGGEGHLIDLVAGETNAPVDWVQVRDPRNWLGDARKLVSSALADD